MDPSPEADAVFSSLREELGVGTPTIPIAPPRRKAFVSVVDTLFYQRSAGNQPVSFPSRYNHELVSTEQAYSRELTVTTDWKGLDHGWLERGFMLKLFNREGTNLTSQPGEAGWADIRSRVVEVGVLALVPDQGRRTQWSEPRPPSVPVVLTLVRPGTDIRIQPDELGRLVVRCRNQTANCTLNIVPE